MKPRSRAVIRWEFTGALFMVLVGSALHFVFVWTGGWRPVALIAAVNESIWEHLKLAFWPGLFWALLPQRGYDLHVRERLAAKGTTLALTAVMIVVVFKSYTAILGRNLLLLDIGTFVLAVFAGQIVFACLAIRGLRGPVLRTLGLTLLIMQLLAYAFFTFYPPDFWLFVDSRTGLRGLPLTMVPFSE
jgi:hypothetical protein